MIERSTIESTVLKALDHPKRRVIVITVTFVVALVTILPSADEYFALRQRREDVETAWGESRTALANLDGLSKRLTQQQSRLAEWERRTASGEEVVAVRDQIVALVRDSHCQVRKIATSDAAERPWTSGDDPLKKTVRAVDKRAKNTKNAPSYTLSQQTLSLTVSGRPADICQLLEGLYSKQLLTHSRNFILRPQSGVREEVTLDLELWLFDLNPTAPTTST